jgi:phosphatidylglycerol---prolipoprotein diacylglyceryl transferase
MAFLGGVIGVVCMLLYIQYKNRFSLGELKLLGDLILCIVPLGIFLGRIANFLNQELIGKAIESFPLWFQQITGYL